MKRFLLVRDVDATGISGTGTVAEGVLFSDGRCALRWRTAMASTTVYDSIEDLEAIHGHGGQTRIAWLDGDERDRLELAHRVHPTWSSDCRFCAPVPT